MKYKLTNENSTEVISSKAGTAKNFADTIKDNPKEIIAWAKREIKEYEKLIKILSKK